MKKLFFVIVLLAPVIATGQGWNVELVGNLNYYNMDCSYDIKIRDSLAFLATGRTGLCIIDISDSTYPVIIGYFDTPDQSWGVDICGNYAYIADRDSGLRIIDISNLSDPQEVGAYITPDEAFDVAVLGSYAYTVCKDSGLQIVNIDNPRNPVVEGFLDTPGFARRIFIDSTLAYVADTEGGLRIIDVSSSANPFELGFMDSSAGTFDVVVSGNYAYLADGNDMRIINITNPGNPLEVGHHNVPWANSCRGLDIVANYCYLAINNLMEIVDVSIPSNPVGVGSYSDHSRFWNVSVSATLAYITDGRGGLRIIDVADPSNPAEVGKCVNKSLRNIVLHRDYACIIDNNEGLRIVNIADSTNPYEVGFCSIPGSERLDISTNFAYVTFDSMPVNGLKVVDISQPNSPYIVGFVNTIGPAHDVVIADNYAYVAHSEREPHFGGGLTVLDISNSLNPFNVSHYCPPCGSVERIAVSGDLVYLKDFDNTFRVIDFSDLSNPLELGACPLFVERISDIVHSDSCVYIISNYPTVINDLYIIDVSNPLVPVLVLSGDFPGRPCDIFTDREFAFIASGGAGLRIYNISDPVNLFEIGYYENLEVPYGVAVSGDLAYVADDNYFRCFDCRDATWVYPYTEIKSNLSFTLLKPHPNPFNASTVASFELRDASEVRLAVYDLAGRLVDTIARGAFPPGLHTAQWNGTGFASGMYFVRMEAGGYNQSRKVVLIK